MLVDDIKTGVERARLMHHSKQFSGRTKSTGNLYVVGKLLKKSSKKIFSEDVSGHIGKMAWVMDGATDVFHENADLYAYMQELNGNMYLVNHDQPLVDVLSSAIDKTSHIVLPTNKLYTLSSFTFTIVRLIKEDTWEYILIGDSFLAYTDIISGKEELITDSRFSAVSNRSNERIQAGIPWLQVVQEERMLMNNQGKEFIQFLVDDGYPNGYWIGSADKRGIKHVLSGIVKAKSLTIYTDGVKDNPYMATGDPHRILSYNSQIDDDQTLLILTN